MPIKVRPSEQTLLNTMATDANVVNGSGLQVQPATPIATSIYPITDYATVIPPASDNETKVKDGVVGFLAPLIRYVGPITGQASNTSPSFTYTATTTLLTLTLSESLEVPRTVEIAVNGNCFSSAINTRMDFWVEVNGTPTTVFKHFLNEASAARSFSGTWIATLPVGAVTITVRSNRGTGAGNIQFDSNNFINVTFKG